MRTRCPCSGAGQRAPGGRATWCATCQRYLATASAWTDDGMARTGPLDLAFALALVLAVRPERADRVNGVGLRGGLVLAVTEHPGESERHATGVATTGLNTVKGDLRHEFRADAHDAERSRRSGLLAIGQGEQPLGLPRQHRVGETLERLAEHDELAGLGIASAEVQVRQPARTPSVAPLR